jgi:hypothetical protein
LYDFELVKISSILIKIQGLIKKIKVYFKVTVVIFKEFFGHFTTFYGNLRKLATIRQKNLRQTTIIFDILRQFTIFGAFLWRPRFVTSIRQFLKFLKFVFWKRNFFLKRKFTPFYVNFSNFWI